jgi:hypothetical protein
MKRWWQKQVLLCGAAEAVAACHHAVTRTSTRFPFSGGWESSVSAVSLLSSSKPVDMADAYEGALMRRACSAACTPVVRSALQVQHRRCATSVPLTSEAAASPAPLLSSQVAAMSRSEFERFFFDQPITQRLAAITVAQHQLAPPEQQTQPPDTPHPEKGGAYMPLFEFVTRAPPLVRDEMFQRQQDAIQWVEASPLLQLVDQEGNCIARHTTPTSKAKSDEGVGAAVAASTYNSLLHVRVAVAPQWVQGMAEVTHPASSTMSPMSSQSDAAASSAVATAAALRGPQGEVMRAAVKDAMVSAMHALDELALQRAAAQQACLNAPKPTTTRTTTATTTAADTVETGSNNNRNFASVCRYFSLIDVLLRIRMQANADKALSTSPPTPPSIRDALQELPIETLEQVVKMYGLPVTIGRRNPRNKDPMTTDASDHYPDASEKCLWVVREAKQSGQHRDVVFVALRRHTDVAPPRFRFVHPRVTSATNSNNYGGWGAMLSVPTKADVYEILKYIPVNWGNVGNLNIPADVRKRHIRCASLLMWFRRQPYYFEVRNMCGTLEVRRSIVLHPEAHGLTKEEACELLELQLATGQANNLIQLTSTGVPVDDSETLVERSAVKLLQRVCPTYFVPMNLVLQRYTKKNLTEAMLLASARRRPQDFEELSTRFSDVVLVRRRGGADSARWRAAFVEDLEKYPEDVRGIMALCNRMCPAWDRPEFIYVRLSASEQHTIGGYAGMQRILRRHPMIFRVGKHFVCRADPSDPLTLQEVEPAHDDVTARSMLREENPYLSARDVALVFHYVAPDNETCTAAYLADCASPAIRCVLPTRIVTVVQQFPKLFACTETSPGVFAIRKLRQRLHRPTPNITGIPVSTATKNGTSVNSTSGSGEAAADTKNSSVDADGTAGRSGAQDDEEDGDLVQMLEDEIAAEEEHLSKEEVIKAILTLVPDTGVEAPQLLLWASMNVQRAANEYYGGVLKLVEALPQHFRVVTTEDAKMIYKA